ncbi:MAG: M56 family metallopeptidase [Bacteroidota bacterium]
MKERREAAPLIINRDPQPLLSSEPVPSSSEWVPVPFRTNWRLPETASPWIALLVGFWLLGFAVEGLRRVRTHRRFVNSLGDRVPVDRAQLLAEVKRLGVSAGLRYPLRLTQSDALVVPVALGVDEIVLPRWAVEDTAPAAQRALLAHEVAHLARRDPFWLAVFAGIESLAFFQPLNHLARRQQQAAAERLCDAWAAEQTSPLAMARCLVDAAGRLRADRLGRASATLPHLVLGMAAVGGASLSDRVEHLIDGEGSDLQRRWPVVLAACCVVSLVACVGPTVTSTAQAPPSPPAVPSATSSPAPPLVVEVPLPPMPPSPPTITEVLSPDSSFTYTRNDDNARMRVEQEGTVTLAADGALQALSEGGRLLIVEELPTVERRYEARTDDEGGLVEIYEVNGTVQPLGADARRWLRDSYDEATSQRPPPPPHPPLPPGISVMPGTGDTFTYTRTSDGRRLQIEQEGRVTYEDGLPVALSEGGRLFIEEEQGGETRRYEARTRADGRMEAVYAVDGVAQALDDAARYWLLRRVEEMKRVQRSEPYTPVSGASAQEYDRQWAAYGRQMDAYARDMEAYAARVDTAGVGQVYDDAHRQYMADYASRMERLAAEMAVVHGRAFEEQMADFGSETEVWGRVYGERMRAQAARLAQLAEEAAQSQDPAHRAELEARVRELARVQIPNVEEQSTAQRRQAEALLREVQRLRHDADRLRYGSESGLVRGTLRARLQDEYTLGFPLAEGSVRVSAGGTDLIEGTDYTVDYDAGTIRLVNRAAVAPGQDVLIDFERQPEDSRLSSSP